MAIESIGLTIDILKKYASIATGMSLDFETAICIGLNQILGGKVLDMFSTSQLGKAKALCSCISSLFYGDLTSARIIC